MVQDLSADDLSNSDSSSSMDLDSISNHSEITAIIKRHSVILTAGKMCMNA